MAGEENFWAREEVLQSLERVLDSQIFASSQQLQSFLSYIIHQKLDGKADGIKAYTIAVDALNKPESFDPQLDPTVRVLAGKLRNALQIYYADEGDNESIKFEMPKGSYRPEIKANPAKPVETHSNDVPTKETESGRWWAIPTVIGIIAIVTAVTLRLSLIEDAPDKHKAHAPIIAIAEFKNISGEADLDGFNSGLRFDLVSELSRFSWISTYAEKSDLEDISPSNVQADYVLRGSLTAANKRIHISYRLESAETGIVQWAQEFDRDFTSQDIFHIQKETVQAIAVEIGTPGGVLNQLEQNRHQQSVGGLNSYLCALRLYDYWKTFAPSTHLEIRNCLEAAIKTDPGYAEAHAALGFIYLHEELLGSNRRSGYNPLERALAEASKATELDQFSILSKRALYTTNLFNGNIAEFKQIGREAIRVNPNNPELLSDFGNRMAINAGQWEEGLKYSKKALELIPNPPPSYFIIFALRAISKGDNFQEVLTWTDRINATDWPFFHMIRAIAYSKMKNLAETQTSLELLNIKSAKQASIVIRGYRMHKPLETQILQQLDDAFKYAKSTS